MSDHDNIVGFWKLVAVVQDDLNLKYCDIGTITEITKTHIKHFKSGTDAEYDLHPHESPKALDYFIQRPDFVVREIYELDGDELRMLHHGMDHKTRPTSMAGIKGDPYLAVHVFRRSNWRPRANREPKAQALLEPGSLIPKDFVQKPRKTHKGEK